MVSYSNSDLASVSFKAFDISQAPTLSLTCNILLQIKSGEKPASARCNSFDDNGFLDIECLAEHLSIEWAWENGQMHTFLFPRILDLRRISPETGEWWWANADGFRKCILSKKNGCFAWNDHFLLFTSREEMGCEIKQH